MASANPTILILAGGWHTPQSYNKLTELATIDTECIRSVAENLVNEGHEVVVLMHSYGGHVGTNALQGLGLERRKKEALNGGVSCLVYLAAHVVQEGKALIDGVRHFGHEHLMPLAFDFADDMSCVSRDPKNLLVGETDLPAAEVDDYLSTLERWNGQTMYQPLTTASAAWRNIPVTYIYTMKDMTVPFEYQKWFVEGMEKAGVEVQAVKLDAGHCANFTAAMEVANIINKLVKGQLQGDLSGETKGASKDDVKDAILKAMNKEKR